MTTLQAPPLALLSGLTSWVEEVILEIGYAGLAALLLLETIFPPIPSELILPFAGALVEDGRMSFLPALLWSTGGAVVGATIIYLVARWGGRTLLFARHWPGVTPEKVASAEQRFDRYGARIVLGGRLLPGIRSLVSIPPGLAAMPFWEFVLLTAFGSAIWNSALIGAGMALGSDHGAVADVIGPVGKVLLLALIAGAAIWGVVVWRRRNATA